MGNNGNVSPLQRLKEMVEDAISTAEKNLKEAEKRLKEAQSDYDQALAEYNEVSIFGKPGDRKPKTAVSKKRGRKPKKTEVEAVAVPKKRGRKPKTEVEPTPKKRGRKPKTEVKAVAVPKKWFTTTNTRGRKPKTEVEGVAPAPKKRGRKPKTEAEGVAPAPKKRGRKPKTEVAVEAGSKEVSRARAPKGNRILDHVIQAIGSGTMKVKDVVQAMRDVGVCPKSNQPETYISVILSSQRGGKNDPDELDVSGNPILDKKGKTLKAKVFERVGHGQYKVASWVPQRESITESTEGEKSTNEESTNEESTIDQAQQMFQEQGISLESLGLTKPLS